MDNQKMVKNAQPVEIHASSKEEKDVIRLEKEEKQYTDQQQPQNSTVEQIGDYEKYILGAENIEDQLDVDSLEWEEEYNTSLMQDSISSEQMSIDAEERKEYLKNGQKMTESMQQAYAEEYLREQKEQQENEEKEKAAQAENLSEKEKGEQQEREKREKLQKATDTMEKSKRIIINECFSLREDADYEEIYRGIIGDRDSASESFERMREAMRAFKFYEDETKDPDVQIDALVRLREAAQAYVDTHSSRRRFTGKGKRRKGFAEALIRILDNIDEKITQNYQDYKLSRLEVNGIDDDVYQEKIMQTKTNVYGDQGDAVVVPVGSIKEIEKVAKYGAMEERLGYIFRLGHYRTVSGKFERALEKYGYQFNLDKYTESMGKLGESFTGDHVSRIVKVRMADMVSQIKMAGTQALFDTYNGYLSENTIPEGMDRETYAQIKLQNSMAAYRQMELPIAVQDSMALNEGIFSFLNGVNEQLSPDMLNQLEHLSDYGTEVNQKYTKVVKKASAQYLAVTQEMQIALFRQLLGSGMLVRISDGKKCTQKDIDRLERLAPQIVADEFDQVLKS